MAERLFNATRSVAPVGASDPADDGGLRLATGWWTDDAQNKTAQDLAGEGSFALLGEPGSGKTETIEQIVQTIGGAEWVHLDEPTNADTLTADLDRALEQAVAAPHRTIVLDGLDECTLPPKTFNRRLKTALDVPRNIRLIVGCRSAAWTNELDELLRASDEEFVVYELLPLSVDDIKGAASENDIDPDQFLAGIHDSGVTALAARPLTLNLLLRVYGENGTLPATPADLFEQGIHLLADEPDLGRAQERQPIGSVEQRVAVARRIAAVATVAGHASATFGTAGDSVLALGSIAGGVESVAAGTFEVTADLVRSTIGTALLQSRVPGQFSFAHSSFAAYLAARYLVEHDLSEDQLRALLTRASATGRVAVPLQLRETATWLIALNPSTYGWLVDVDPDAVLAYCAYLRDNAIRELLVDRLLADEWFAVRMRWVKWPLNHPGVYEQIRPALEAPLREDAGPHFGHPVSRRAGTAMDIARGTRDPGLVRLLRPIIANPELNSYLRSKAAHVARDLDPDQIRDDLRVVLDEVGAHPNHDPDDELRGIALEAWLPNLSAVDLVRFLSRPQNHELIGAYYMVQRRLSELVPVATMVELVDIARRALAESQATGQEGPTPFGEPRQTPRRRGRTRGHVAEQILHRLLESKDAFSHHADTVGWLMAYLLINHEAPMLPAGVFDDDVDGSEERRRSLILAVLPHLPARRVYRVTQPIKVTSDPNDLFVSASFVLLRATDLAWLFDQNDQVAPDSLRRLISRTYDWSRPDHQQMAWDSREKPGLEWIEPTYFGAVSLEGPEADQLREDLRDHEVRDAARHTGHVWEHRDSHEHALQDLWAKCQDDETSGVPELLALLRVDPSTGSRTDPLNLDLTTWPGVTSLQIEPDDLIALLLRFLPTVTKPPGDWVNEPYTSLDVIDLYAALQTALRHVDRPALEAQISDAAWEQLAPIIVRASYAQRDDNNEPNGDFQTLVSILTMRIPSTFRDTQLQWVQHQIDAGIVTVADLRVLRPVYNDEVHAALTQAVITTASVINETVRALSALDTPDNPDSADLRQRTRLEGRLQSLPVVLANTVDFIFAQRGAVGAPEIRSLFTTVGTEDAACAQVRVRAAISLLRHGDISWVDVEASRQSDAAFHEALITAIVTWPEGSVLEDLTVEELAALWTEVTGGTETTDGDSTSHAAGAPKDPAEPADPKGPETPGGEPCQTRSPEAQKAAPTDTEPPEDKSAAHKEDTEPDTANARDAVAEEVVEPIETEAAVATDEAAAPLAVAEDDPLLRPRRRAKNLADHIVGELIARSTRESLNALARLANAHPGNYDLAHAIDTSDERTRADNWTGTSVDDFMTLVHDAALTVVHDADSLYRAVKRLLDQFEHDMHDLGEHLWNEIPPAGKGQPSTWRPKPEASISNLLAHELKRGLNAVIVNREVEVRRTTSRHGLAVDVLTSIGDEGRDGEVPTCPIEVKGSWNTGLLTDLREQLVDDYMHDLHTDRGIFVCGWFDVDEWTATNDTRLSQAKKLTRADAGTALSAAALAAQAELSVEVTAKIIGVPRPKQSERAV